MIKYSIIIPVFNRPDEVEELLDSLSRQSIKPFEVIVVEDGSSIPCKEVVDRFTDRLVIQYHFKNNSGPGETRNVGASFAIGEYVLFFDSDCILPEVYFENLEKRLDQKDLDAFGGPDASHEHFSPIQKAIGIAMTSPFTTGGIRGGSEQLGKYQLRSFNMGIRKHVYDEVGGFPISHFGEDIDLSMRITGAGYSTGLIREAWVYHKRRTNFKKFFRQIYHFGKGRIVLMKRYPETYKLTFFLPSLFILGCAALIIVALVWHWMAIIPLLMFIVIMFVEGWMKSKSAAVGLLTILASFIQLFAYGLGFGYAYWRMYMLGKTESDAFQKNTYG